MRKFLIVLILLSFILTGCNTTSDNKDENDNYTISRVTTTDNTASKTTINIENDNINTETELSSFSTKIYTPNDQARQNNIRITCSKLDGTIVKSRRNFFFL